MLLLFWVTSGSMRGKGLPENNLLHIKYDGFESTAVLRDSDVLRRVSMGRAPYRGLCSRTVQAGVSTLNLKSVIKHGSVNEPKPLFSRLECWKNRPCRW